MNPKSDCLADSYIEQLAEAAFRFGFKVVAVGKPVSDIEARVCRNAIWQSEAYASPFIPETSHCAVGENHANRD